MKSKDSQRGSVGFKPLITILIVFLLGNAAYNYVPAAYNAENLRAEMHTAVLQGMSLPPTMGNPIDVTKRRIYGVMKANNIPDYAFVEVKNSNNILQAHVAYTQLIPVLPFGFYDYNYQFDYSTANGSYFAKE